MLKYTGFKKVEVKGEQYIRLYLANDETEFRTHIDCDMSLDKYNVAMLIGQEYQSVKSVADLVKVHKLTERNVSNYVRIDSFKLGA